jgi:glyoxylase I family protein
MAAPFKIVGIDHVLLRAADPAALERFYLDVLGLTFELRQGKLAQLRAGQALVDIVPADEPGPAPRYIEHRRGQPRSPVPTG